MEVYCAGVKPSSCLNKSLKLWRCYVPGYPSLQGGCSRTGALLALSPRLSYQKLFMGRPSCQRDCIIFKGYDVFYYFH